MLNRTDSRESTMKKSISAVALEAEEDAARQPRYTSPCRDGQKRGAQQR